MPPSNCLLLSVNIQPYLIYTWVTAVIIFKNNHTLCTRMLSLGFSNLRFQDKAIRSAIMFTKLLFWKAYWAYVTS